MLMTVRLLCRLHNAIGQPLVVGERHMEALQDLPPANASRIASVDPQQPLHGPVAEGCQLTIDSSRLISWEAMMSTTHRRGPQLRNALMGDTTMSCLVHPQTTNDRPAIVMLSLKLMKIMMWIALASPTRRHHRLEMVLAAYSGTVPVTIPKTMFASLARYTHRTTDTKTMVVRTGHVVGETENGLTCPSWKSGVQKRKRVGLWKGCDLGRSASLSW